MKVKLAFAILGIGLAAAVMPLLAHHSVPAQYDVSKIITIQGVVTKTEWMNPHARSWVDAKNDNGTVSNWEMELAPPNALKRAYGKMDPVKPGDQVTVSLFRAKDGSTLAHTLTVTFPDGRVLNFPYDPLVQWGATPPSK